MWVRTEIGLPVCVDDAWRILTGWESQAAWMRDADAIVVTSPNREGVGVRIDVKTRVLGVPAFTDRLEVVAWDPPRRLVMEHRRVVGGTGEWCLFPAGDGCRFRWTEDVSLPVPVLGELALAIYKPLLRRLMGLSGANLRSFVSARASGRPRP